jgi:hypothetical protein
MRTFYGTRPNPPAEYIEKGITNAGEGCDYEGVIFSDGTVVIRWMTEFQSHSVWKDYESFYQVHGHPEYGTEIVFLDGEAAPYHPEGHP